jgi:hypothetical protein
MRLYDELASWWPVLSAPADYAEEAGLYLAALEAAAPRPLATLLELGSGGGNVASHLVARLTPTLTDLSPAMLEVSARLNPTCEHLQGDMRTLRLGRRFDAVLVQDAVMYMTTEEDLARTMATARAHLAPGAVALFVPDHVRETWRPTTHEGGHDLGLRALRYVLTETDDDPADSWIDARFEIHLREGPAGTHERTVCDTHRWGLFPRASWLRLLDAAGFEPRALPYAHSTFDPAAPRTMFLGRARG